MEIKSLRATSLDTLFEAFSQAFAEYELQLNKQQLHTMLTRRGFDPDLSFAAFDDNGKIVAFTFNGIGHFNGIPTAYDTGTGTLKAYQGKGLATRIFEYSIPILKEAGIRQYLLEVLQHNTKAVSVYRNLGFRTTREFNYFNQKNEEVITNCPPINIPYSIQPIDVKQYPCIADFLNFHPSWQNCFDSIKRSQEEFVSLGVFTENRLIAYCVFEPIAGDVTQLAVDKPYRRKGIASLLLQKMIGLNKNDSIKIINTDTEDNSVTAFLHAKNIPLKGKQFEMIRKL